MPAPTRSAKKSSNPKTTAPGQSLSGPGEPLNSFATYHSSKRKTNQMSHHQEGQS